MVSKYLIALSLISAVVVGAAPAAAQTAAPDAAPKAAFTTTDTDIGTLLDNPQTRAVIDANLPKFSSNPQIEMARSMTLKQVESYSNGAITDEILAKIDAQLAKIPAK